MMLTPDLADMRFRQHILSNIQTKNHTGIPCKEPTAHTHISGQTKITPSYETDVT